MWTLSEAIFQAIKRINNFIICEEKPESNIPFLLFVTIRTIIFNITHDVIYNIILNPKSQPLYYVLSRSFSPYSEEGADVIRKLSLLRRAHICVETKTPSAPAEFERFGIELS